MSNACWSLGRRRDCGLDRSGTYGPSDQNAPFGRARSASSDVNVQENTPSDLVTGGVSPARTKTNNSVDRPTVAHGFFKSLFLKQAMFVSIVVVLTAATLGLRLAGGYGCAVGSS